MLHFFLFLYLLHSECHRGSYSFPIHSTFIVQYKMKCFGSMFLGLPKKSRKLLNFFVRIEFSLQNVNSAMTKCFSFSFPFCCRQNAIDFSASNNALFVNKSEERGKKEESDWIGRQWSQTHGKRCGKIAMGEI